jgi:2,3-bisphosphoglycerate-dependent phosphoglycerate mutase
MRIFFVRHGQSENNALWARTQSRHGRLSDPPLTELGRRQLVYTAQFLDYCLTGDISAGNDPSCCAMESGVVYLFCSLMERSVQSGQIIAERLNLPLMAEPDIHENGGIYNHHPQTDEPIGQTGNTRAYYETHYPELVLPKEMNEQGWWNRPFEKREDSIQRASRALQTLKDHHGASGDTIILISHGGFYNYFLSEILGVSRPEHIWFELFNGAITLIQYDEDSANIIYCNRYSFMPTDLVS